MPSEHADKFRPSSAHRALACTASVLLEAEIPDPETTVYAQEGTNAHTMCENKLRELLGLDFIKDFDFEHDEEMDRCTDGYRDFVEEELNEAKSKTEDAKLFIEQRLELTAYIPDCFGTSDAVIVSDDTLEVIDFKYGKGVPVNAKDNPQLKLYALGAYESLKAVYDFTNIKTTIYQPRLDSVSSDEFTVESLLEWANDIVKPKVQEALSGNGTFKTGDHCRFCKAAATCRARAEEAFEIINRDQVKPPLLDDEEIPEILDKLDATESWIKALREYVQAKALNGHKWPGYKLVEARTNRKISNQLEALSRLEQAGYSSDQVTNVKLKGLTDLEKVVGKSQFVSILGDLIVKPKGEPTLVKDSDKRQEINLLEDIFKED